MDLLTPALVGISLSMDCFAAGLAIGSGVRQGIVRAAVLGSLSYGGFQAGMTLLGWVAGVAVIDLISAYDHWIAFLLLLLVGGRMMADGLRGEEPEGGTDVLRAGPLLMLSLATSIDALAVGVSFGILRSAIVIPALVIGLICMAISFSGVLLGERLEKLLGSSTEIAGGILLVLIGVRILTEHLFGM